MGKELKTITERRKIEIRRNDTVKVIAGKG